MGPEPGDGAFLLRDVLRPQGRVVSLTMKRLVVADDGAEPARVQKFRDAGVQVEVAQVTA